MSTLIAVTVAVAATYKLTSIELKRRLTNMTRHRDDWRKIAVEGQNEIATLKSNIEEFETALSLAVQRISELEGEPEQTPFDALCETPPGELLPSQWLGSADEMTAVPIGCAAETKAGNGNQS